MNTLMSRVRDLSAGMVLVIMLMMLCCSPAKAQTGIINCPLVDTTSFNSGPNASAAPNGYVSVVSNCVFTQPDTAMALVFVQGMVTCGANSDIRLSVFFGNTINDQHYGASFNGQISGSTLTVNSMNTSSPNVIVPANTPRLYDTFSGSQIPIVRVPPTGPLVGYDTGLWIVSQNDGTAGGVGHYTLNTSVATPVPAETMWALQTRPTAIVVASNTYEQFACNNGTTSIESFAGGLSASALGGPGAINWVQVEITAETIGGLPSQSASLTNAQVFIVLPPLTAGPGPSLTGGLVQ